MTADLYSIAFDNRQLDKVTGESPINVTPIPIAPTGKIELLSPVFNIEFDASYAVANYLYCNELDRYYYIENAVRDTAGRLDLHCRVDVLQSFSAAIKNSMTTILRTAALQYPTQIPDQQLPVNPSRKQIVSIVLEETSGTFDTDAQYSYLLTVVGGQPSV